MLRWDYNRLWGSFEFGFFQGILLIDPAPNAEILKESKTYLFEWRGTSPGVPDTIFNNALLTNGEIELGEVGKIRGHFNAMLGEDRCEFHGKTPFGPALVARSLQSFVDEWNDYNFLGDDETIRLPSVVKDDSECEESTSIESIASPIASSTWAEDDREQFLGAVTGIFNISSEVVEGEWPAKARNVSIRFHIDRERDKVWGKFNMGICEGFLLFDKSPDDLMPDDLLEFRWRGREDETGRSKSGGGEVTISEKRRIKGSFRGLYGENLDFEGGRNFMPSRISGYEPSYYKNQWDEYGAS